MAGLIKLRGPKILGVVGILRVASDGELPYIEGTITRFRARTCQTIMLREWTTPIANRVHV